MIEYDTHELINECKRFWQVIDFEKEILNWKFKSNIPKDLHFNIGHPQGSHKGESLGDMLPYTRLPEIIKNAYPNARVSIPTWFRPVFEHNPFIDDYDWMPQRWGSLGTWGTSVQRTTNVWGLKTFDFTPNLYCTKNKTTEKLLLFCVNSKTGGQITNIELFEEIIEELKSEYYCVQLGMKNDPIVQTANEYAFNVSSTNLISFMKQFDSYIGSQNSIYHLAKALDLNTIGILPRNVYPELVVLPLLTQVNWLEVEMLTRNDRHRRDRWIEFIKKRNINPNESHHIGWLYPDCTHLTERNDGTFRCPTLSVDNMIKAINNRVYPFNDDKLWNIDKHRSLWMED